MAVAGYFLESMPERTEIEVIERWEHGPLFDSYHEYRDCVLRDLGTAPSRANAARESIEAWLFCCTDAVDNVLTDGFPATNENLHNSRFGLGVYFARDPRLPHCVLHRHGMHTQGRFQIILARVVAGRCFKQKLLRSANDPVQDEHCRPPPTYHSCTLSRAPGCEVITFPALGGTPAYPAYVFTYHTQAQLTADPYEEVALLRLAITQGKVKNANPFKQYKSKCRPFWSTPGSSGDRVLAAGAPLVAVRARGLEKEPEALGKIPQRPRSASSIVHHGQRQRALERRPRSASAMHATPQSGVSRRPQSALGTLAQAKKDAQAAGHEALRRPKSALARAQAGVQRKSTQLSMSSSSSLASKSSPCSFFRSQSTGEAMSMRIECAETSTPSMRPSACIGTVAIEVSNVPDVSLTGLRPEVYVKELLNPKLRQLPDFDRFRGEAVRSSRSKDSETVILEMQSKWIVASTARILDDLTLFGQKLQVRIVPVNEGCAPEACQVGGAPDACDGAVIM